MQIFYESSEYVCNSCRQESKPGVLFPGIEIIIDGTPFERKFFLCQRCLEEAVNYLGQTNKEKP